MDALWRIELLGGLRAVRGEQAITRFATQKVAALLAYLAFHRERSHTRDELVELLWPESAPEAGRRCLRVALTSLRHQLEPAMPGGRGWGAVLIANRRHVQLNPVACTTDVATFEAAWREASRAGTAGERVPRLAAAVSLYQGELLPGCAADWILPHRQWLAETYQQALGQLIRLLHEGGDRGAALQYARQAVAADPLREEAREALIRLLAGTGAPTAALKEYTELERLLEREWGAAPTPEIRALAHGLRGSGGQVVRASGIEVGLSEPVIPCVPEPVNPPLPTGTVTFLLVDLEGTAVPEQGQARLRPLFRGHGGHELQAGGRTLQVVFGRASDAVAAAVAGMKAPCPRMAMHTGEVEPGEDLAASAALQHTLRLLWAAHPGQILVTERSAVLLGDQRAAGAALLDLGVYHLADQPSPERLFQACPAELPAQRFPPPQAAPVQSGNLPLQLTRFLGREAEIAALCTLLVVRRRDAEDAEEGKTAAGGTPASASRPLRRGSEEAVSPPSGPRLVTLTGPGGSGKTRLALEVAARLCGVSPDGRPPSRVGGQRSGGGSEQRWSGAGPWFVPLADLSDPALIPDQMLEALGLPRSPQMEPLEQVVAALSGSPSTGGEASLLLLDNFEQLVEGGTSLAQRLLARVPGLILLITSRQRLDLPGEREFPVGPLPIPGVQAFRCSGVQDEAIPSFVHRNARTPEHLNGLLQCPSVALFLDRARAARPDFQLTPANAAAVAALCRRLEGLPLAIELAAARAWALTPQQMLARLSTPFELLTTRQRGIAARHRGLRAALDWSYQPLAPELQRFFARLSVFRGGWTLAAAAAVCDEPQALEYLEELGKRSLLVAEGTGVGCSGTPRREGGLGVGYRPEHPIHPPFGGYPNTQHPEAEIRFRLLEPLREYAAEQLTAPEREAAARRHARYYLAQAEAAEPWLQGASRDLWLARLARERDNLRAALEWCLASGVEVFRCSGFQEDESEATSLRAPEPLETRTPEHLNTRTPEHPSPVEIGLRLAGALPWFWYFQGAWSEGRRWLEAALTFASPRSVGARSGGTRSARAKLYTGAGALAWLQGELAAAQAHVTKGEVLWKAVENQRGAGFAQYLLGVIAGTQADYVTARKHLEAGVETARAVADTSTLALALASLGHTVLLVGDGPSARALCQESLDLARRIGDRWLTAWSLRHLGEVMRLHNEYARAREIYSECLSLFRGLGDTCGAASALENLAEVAHQQADYEPAITFYHQALATWRELGQRQAAAWALERLGEVARCRGEFAEARALFEESLAIRQELGQHSGVAWSLLRLGRAALHEADLPQARRLLEQSHTLFEDQDDQRGLAAARHGLGLLAQADADLAAAVSLLRQSLAMRVELREQRDIAEGMGALAAVYQARGDAARAARLFGAEEALREALGTPLPPSEQPLLARQRAALSAALGEARLTAAWHEGRAMPVEQAVALALEARETLTADRSDS